MATLAKGISSSERSETGMYIWPFGGEKQINVDSRGPRCFPSILNRDGDPGLDDGKDMCKRTPCGCAVDVDGCATGKGWDSSGMPCPKENPYAEDHEASATWADLESTGNLGSGTNTTTIPLGGEYGAQLHLYHRAFLPDGWTYTISDTGWVTTPDTVTISITHPVPVSCGDTA